MAATEQHVVQFQMEPQDLQLAQKLNFRILIFSRSFLFMLGRVWILAMLAYGGLLYVRDGWEKMAGVLIWFAPLFLVVLWCTPWAVMRFLSWRAARKAARSSDEPPLTITLKWNDETISWSSRAGDVETRWADFVKAGQDDHFLLLFETEALYRIIPKRVLSAEEAADLGARIARIGKA
ncbi:YcxB family protein [Xanthobacter sp. TB0136]|uniref:YcxB family protein n=1 Tax=Xanthobacter sp. TB0136 TaxID=3459177 RepID=UPI004039D631